MIRLLSLCLLLGVPLLATAQAPGESRSSVTRPPTLLHEESAQYPTEALREGRGGSVKLLVTLDEQGRVSDVSVRAPAGHGFDEAAVQAVRRFRFSPAEVDGVPTAIQLEYVYHFVPPQPAPAPTATLTGQLLELGRRSSVSAATVRCAGQQAEALSDEEGRFTLKTAAGPCTVEVTAEGFLPFATQEKLSEGETLEVRYNLRPELLGGETVVRAERERKEVVRRSLGRKEASRVPGTFGDPVRVLQAFPGVGRAQYVLGALFVRGSSPLQTRTLIDGVEVPSIFHVGSFGPSVINPEFLSRVDFYPGGFGARYGRAVGGVVEVSTRKGAADTLHGSMKLDLVDTSVFLEAPVAPGVSVSGGVRRSWIDGVLPLLQTDTQVPRYWDYQLRVDLGSSRDAGANTSSTAYLMAFGSDDVLQTINSRGEVLSEVQTSFHRLKGDWTLRQGALTSVFTPYAGYGTEGGDLGVSTYSADIFNLGAREDVSLVLSRELTLRGGLDLLFTRWVARAELPSLGGTNFPPFPGSIAEGPTQSINRTIDSFDGATYVEADLRLGPLTLTPGLRGSWARVYGRDLTVLDPRLWARWQLQPNLSLRASAGLFSQPPEGLRLEPAPLGNPNLIHERAFQSSLGVAYELSPTVEVDVTGFYNRRYDNIVTTNQLVRQDDGSLTLVPYANAGLGRAYGLELLLRHAPTQHFFGWLSYTLSRSEVRTVGGAGYQEDDFDQTHVLTLVGSYRLPWELELGARLRLVSGRPMVRVQHDYDQYSADADSFFPTLLGPPRMRLPVYHQLDMRLERSFIFDRWTLAVYLDLQNAYNAANTESLLYDYRFRYTVPVPGFPMLPVLGVKGSF